LAALIFAIRTIAITIEQCGADRGLAGDQDDRNEY